MNIVLIAFNNLDMGVYALDAYLKEKGYKPFLIEFNHLKLPLEYPQNDYFTARRLRHPRFPKEDLHNLIETLSSIQPHIIGLSVSSVMYQTACWITEELKNTFNCPVIWGGVHAIIAPEDCIKHADIVCIGEGEEAFFEVIETLRRNEKITNIANLWIKQAANIQKNPRRALVNNLDQLPMSDRGPNDRKYLIDQGRVVRNPILNAGYVLFCYPMMTSRGCRYACSFCTNSVIAKKYKDTGSYLRRRSVENVICELRSVVQKMPISTIRFWDDVFTYDEEWIDEFCSRYSKEVAKPFHCYGHPKKTKKSVVRKLAGVGLTMLCVGVQSGSEKFNLDRYDRSQSNNDIIQFVRYIQSLAVTPNIDIIVDNVRENDKSHFETFELLSQFSRPYKVQIFSLCYFPKTKDTIQALAQENISVTDVEHVKGKALNNFYLDILRAPSKQNMFWDCLIAMRVNRYFPTSMIALCRRIWFFRSFPETLFWICYMWMSLCKSRGRQIVQKDWLTPVLVRKSYLDHYIIHPENERLYKKNISSNRVYCVPFNNECEIVYSGTLPFRRKTRGSIGFQLVFWKLHEKDLKKVDIWRVYELNIENDKQCIRFQRNSEGFSCIHNKGIKKMYNVCCSGVVQDGKSVLFVSITLLEKIPPFFDRKKQVLGSALCVFLTRQEPKVSI